MTTIAGNRGQLWTSTLSPHLLSPHLDFPDGSFSFIIVSARIVEDGENLDDAELEDDELEDGELGHESEDRELGRAKGYQRSRSSCCHAAPT